MLLFQLSASPISSLKAFHLLILAGMIIISLLMPFASISVRTNNVEDRFHLLT